MQNCSARRGGGAYHYTIWAAIVARALLQLPWINIPSQTLSGACATSGGLQEWYKKQKWQPRTEFGEYDRMGQKLWQNTEIHWIHTACCNICNISISYGNLLRCVPWGQWGTSEAPVRQLSPPWVAQPDPPDLPNLRADQQISTDFIRIFGNLWNAVACHFKLRLRQGVGLFAPEHPEHLNWSSASGWIICICVIGTGEVFPETISRSKHMPDFCSKTTYLPTGSLMPLYTFSEAPVPQCGENMTTWLWVLYRASAHTQQRGPSQNKHGSWEGPTSFLMFIQQKEIACKASKCSLLRQSNTKQL